MKKQMLIKKEDVPESWSTEVADFINKLMQRKASNRLGLRGIKEIMEHPWLKFFPWKELYNKNIKSPFIPKNCDNFNEKHAQQVDDLGYETEERYKKLLSSKKSHSIFAEFGYSWLLEQKIKFVNPHEGNDFKEETVSQVESKPLQLSKLKNKSLVLAQIRKDK